MALPATDDVLERDSLSVSLIIRLARAEDLPLLEWYGLHRPHREIIATAFAMQERGNGAMILTEVNGFPAGQICIDFARKRRYGRATFWALRVFPPLRGVGLGKRLMNSAERCTLDHGFTEAELGVDRDNGGVLGFYDRLGYTVRGTEKGHYSYRSPEGEAMHMPIDQWILRKRLDPLAGSLAGPLAGL